MGRGVISTALRGLSGGEGRLPAGLSASGQTQEDVVSLIFPIAPFQLPHTYPKPPEKCEKLKLNAQPRIGVSRPSFKDLS